MACRGYSEIRLCGMSLARFVVRRCMIARLLAGSSLARFVVRRP